MTNLADLLDLDELERDIRDGFIQRRPHPEFPQLRILNYTERTQYEKHWTRATRTSRGLIYDHDTGDVIARPFAKFMNYSEHDPSDFDLDAPILGAFDKKDGSMGVGYVRPDGTLAIATRGSFTSDQAIHATAKVDEVAHLFVDGKTPLFEIIYKANRIVLDYGDRDELIHLGWVDNESGEYEPPADFDSYAGTLREVLSLAPRPNAEGLVAWVDSTTAVKFKQEDYVALHRAIFSLSAKEVWRQLSAGTYDEFVKNLPDEFYKDVDAIAHELRRRYDVLLAAGRAAVEDVTAQGFTTQKEKALWLQRNTAAPVTGFAFRLLADKDVADSIWRVLEPSGAGMTLD